jgi:DNA-binding beta-propeller fold protein YncE
VSLALDSAGNLYVADDTLGLQPSGVYISDSRVRRVRPDGNVSLLAGGGSAAPTDGAFGPDLSLAECVYLTVSADVVYLALCGDERPDLVGRLDADRHLHILAGATEAMGFAGDGSSALSALFSKPRGLAVDPTLGAIYVADSANDRIRRFTPGGAITTVAGNGEAGYCCDKGEARSAQLYGPVGVAVDADGNVYIADTNNDRVRRVDGHGIITTVAGNGSPAFNGDNQSGHAASLHRPEGLALDGRGHLYIADSGNNRIRRLDLRTGLITTVAGYGDPKLLSDPSAVAVSPHGYLYIADVGNHRIVKLAPLAP